MTLAEAPDVIRQLPTRSWRIPEGASVDELLSREWLVANGLGGYASGTIAGVPTRRYHGLLIAALPAPLGRLVMLNHLTEKIRLPDGSRVQLGGEETVGSPLSLHSTGLLAEFRLEAGIPVWRYELGPVTIEKRLILVHQQDTVHISYRLIGGSRRLRLRLQPAFHFRGHEVPVSEPPATRYAFTAIDERYEISPGPELPALRLSLHGLHTSFRVKSRYIRGVYYRLEADRGYPATETLWSPGYFSVVLKPGHNATLVASTEAWETITAISPEQAHGAELERRRRLLEEAELPHPVGSAVRTDSTRLVEAVRTADPTGARDSNARGGPAAELVLAADKFIITPVGRGEDAARARAAGDEMRTVIAGYHWFTDWGRDTMISLEGLTLATGRYVEAGYILRTFAYYIRDGLIPNMFPEGEREGRYHTTDATLWFFHALDRYVEATGDRATLRLLLPKLLDIVDHHLRGTHFNIGVDSTDGLLRQGAEGYQLTWMDAKVGDWVVTPRRGKAVEINALWHNALRLLEGWVREEHSDQAAQALHDHAARAKTSFNRRFWYTAGDYLYDVVDGEQGDDPACRPNQILAISLRHPVLDGNRWERVVQVVRERLLTPVGLRSLAPGHPDYKAQYYGDLRARDAAYHQGTVWSWLIGPFIDAWLRVYPDRQHDARNFLIGLVDHLEGACVGSVSEIFDAEQPYTPRGCIAQAWGVAELLRSWLKVSQESGIRNQESGVSKNLTIDT